MHNRPKVTAYIAASVDGYIARENGDISWLSIVQAANEDYGYSKFMASVDTIVMGRNTYEKVLTFGEWPYHGKRVVVLSTTLKTVNVYAELFNGNIRDLYKTLATDNCKHIYADGGATIRHFLQAGHLDQLILSIIPVILGAGIRLFENTLSEIPCHLNSSQTYPSGLIQVCYEIKRR